MEVVLSPLIARLIHNPVLLAIHSLSSLTLALLAEEDDGDETIAEVNLNTIEGVLSHWSGFFDSFNIQEKEGSGEISGQLADWHTGD